MSFLPRAGMSALKVPPILNCGIRSSRMFRTTCASLITTRLMIGVPGATSSPRLGKIVAICPSSGSSEPGVYKKGGNFIHRAACGIYKATCGCAVFALRAVHSHLILLVCRAFGSLCSFVHGFYFVLSLRSNHTVFIKGEDALIGGLGKRQVALRLIPKLQGCSDNLPARSGINLFVLFLRHLFQSIYLTVFGFDSGTVDDNERVTRFYPIPLLRGKNLHAPAVSADAYLRGFYLPLQHHWLPAHK